MRTHVTVKAQVAMYEVTMHEVDDVRSERCTIMSVAVGPHHARTARHCGLHRCAGETHPGQAPGARANREPVSVAYGKPSLGERGGQDRSPVAPTGQAHLHRSRA